MTCESFSELMPDYGENRLPAREAAFAREHLELCESCRADFQMWQSLSALAPEQPSPNARARFDAMLGAYEEGRWEKNARRKRHNWLADLFRPALAVPLASALAACLLLVGFIAGERVTNSRSGNNEQLAQVQSELTSMRQLVALSLLEEQSASQRLQGVNFSTQVERPAPEIASALLHALRFDSSVDVRLAALDALRRYKQDTNVRNGLMNALHDQQSPLVQIALIDLFVEMHEGAVKNNLRQIEQDTKINPVVRQRAQWGIQQLS